MLILYSNTDYRIFFKLSSNNHERNYFVGCPVFKKKCKVSELFMENYLIMQRNDNRYKTYKTIVDVRNLNIPFGKPNKI